MPRICLSESDLSRPWQGDGMGTALEWHDMRELASTVRRWHVGDPPAFDLYLLPRAVAVRSQIAVARETVKQSGVCDGWGEAYCVGART
jgi:hypothetical protein